MDDVDDELFNYLYGPELDDEEPIEDDYLPNLDDYVEEAVAQSIEEFMYWILDPKMIDGALRSAVHAHGPISSHGRTITIADADGSNPRTITTCGSFSAAKRLRGAMRSRAKEFFKRRQERRSGF